MAGDVTQLLQRWREGDHQALDELTPLVYDELRRLAQRHMSRERPGHTLQATALANEAYLKLAGYDRIDWNGRAHFLGVASAVIRGILLDHARGRRRLKRGGEMCFLELNEELAPSSQRSIELVALDDALHDLAKLDAQQARVVELRYFGGLSIEESAEVLGISVSTVKRDWVVAKTWLYKHLKRENP